MLRPIYDFSFSELQNFLNDKSHPKFRAKQIWEGLYHQLWTSPQQFLVLPKNLRDALEVDVDWHVLEPIDILQSSDGETIKTAFALQDGLIIEAVLMRYDKRRTLCISTQAGCAMGCVFCATGQMGFKRHLNSGEIISQVMYYARLLQKTDEKVTNIVIMGMGEPFHNFEATLKAVDILHDPSGFNFGERRVTISTVGLVPEIIRFANLHRQINLAVSLHAADNTTRSDMLPINNKYAIEELIDACKYYIRETNRRITFEWALIDNINDSIGSAQALAKLLRGMLCHVNIILLNPTNSYSGKPTTPNNAKLFKQVLEENGIPCTIRLRRGIDIQAGCGQLAAKNKFLDT
jgi:23S rRNA (adenine2503-C2)-methyltransferase